MRWFFTMPYLNHAAVIARGVRGLGGLISSLLSLFLLIKYLGIAFKKIG